MALEPAPICNWLATECFYSAEHLFLSAYVRDLSIPGGHGTFSLGTQLKNCQEDQIHAQGGQKGPQSHSLATGSIPTHPTLQWTVQRVAALVPGKVNTPQYHLQQKAICKVSCEEKHSFTSKQNRRLCGPTVGKAAVSFIWGVWNPLVLLTHHSTCLLQCRVAQSHLVCTQCIHHLCSTSLHFT